MDLLDPARVPFINSASFEPLWRPADLPVPASSVQEGVAGGNWRVHAWYKKQGELMWTEDAGNDGRLGRRCVRVQTLLGAMRLML